MPIFHNIRLPLHKDCLPTGWTHPCHCRLPPPHPTAQHRFHPDHRRKTALNNSLPFLWPPKELGHKSHPGNRYFPPLPGFLPDFLLSLLPYFLLPALSAFSPRPADTSQWQIGAPDQRLLHFLWFPFLGFPDFQ